MVDLQFYFQSWNHLKLRGNQLSVEGGREGVTVLSVLVRDNYSHHNTLLWAAYK